MIVFSHRFIFVHAYFFQFLLRVLCQICYPEIALNFLEERIQRESGTGIHYPGVYGVENGILHLR